VRQARVLRSGVAGGGRRAQARRGACVRPRACASGAAAQARSCHVCSACC
jgi:hypothetical protein